MVALCLHARDRVGHSLGCSRTWMNTLSSLALRPMKTVEKGHTEKLSKWTVLSKKPLSQFLETAASSGVGNGKAPGAAPAG